MAREPTTYIRPTERGNMTRARATRIFLSRNGVCCLCGGQIRAHADSWFIEHPEALNLGGSDDDKDLWPAHTKCKPAKDAADKALISDRNRVITKNCEDAPRRSRPLPGTRASGIRKRMNGQVERW